MMKSNNNHIDHKISGYLDGELTPGERDEFETHLVGCEECRQLIEPYKHMEDLLKDYRGDREGHVATDEMIQFTEDTLHISRKRKIEDHLRSCSTCTKLLEAVQVLDDVGKNMTVDAQPATETESSRHGLFFQRRLIPAGIAGGFIIIALIVILFLPDPNPYAELIEITPAPYVPPALRGDGIQELFQIGMDHYIDGDFGFALAVLQNVVQREPDNPQYRFFFGVTLLLTGEYREGLDHLGTDTVMNSVYQDEAKWYAAHAHLMIRNPEEAAELLRQLSVTYERFAEKADSLLQKLEGVSR